MILSTRRMLVVLVLLSLCGSVQLLRGRAENRPNPPKLQSFPSVVGQWVSREEPIPEAMLDVLGPGDFLSRNYERPSEPAINLFIAYFATQRSGDTIHSPKNCLPGSGWQPINSAAAEVSLGNGSKVPVTRYVVAKGDERELVLYWFQSHGKTTSSEYTAKLQLVTDAIRLNRTDGALVRVVTPVLQQESPEQSAQRAEQFIRTIYPELNNFIPR